MLRHDIEGLLLGQMVAGEGVIYIGLRHHRAIVRMLLLPVLSVTEGIADAMIVPGSGTPFVVMRHRLAITPIWRCLVVRGRVGRRIGISRRVFRVRRMLRGMAGGAGPV